MKRYLLLSSLLLAACSGSSTLQTYRNGTYGFSIQYPTSMLFVTPSYSLLEDKIAQIQIPKEAYPKTNFGDGAVALSAQYALSKDECFRVSSSVQSIHGIKFAVTEGTEGAAGNRYASRTYRTFIGGNLCFEISETVHTSVLENYPEGSVTAVDTEKVWSQLDAVVQSLRFN